MTRPVIGVTIHQEQFSAGRALLDWKILAKDDGFILQVIYSGSIDTKLSLAGDVAGQKSFVGYLRSTPTPAEQYGSAKEQVRIQSWIGIVGGIFLFILSVIPPSMTWSKKMVFKQLRKVTAILDEQTRESLPQTEDEIKIEEDKTTVWLRRGIALFALSMIGLSIGALYFLSAPLPPFEF